MVCPGSVSEPTEKDKERCISMIFSSLILNSLLVVLASILLDFILGVLISIKKRTFSLSKLPQFLVTNLLPYIAALVTLALLSVYLSELEYLYYGAVAFVTAKFTKEALLDKIKELFI